MFESHTRPHQFAGSWYPETLEEAESYWTPVHNAPAAKAVVVPHSGWMFSGRIAGAVYGRIQPADTLVLGTNHTGKGKSATSLFAHGRWFLPETKVDIDEQFTEDLMRASEYIAVDYDAHVREHSIEVQLPFLLLLNPKARIVPIVMKEHDVDIFHDVGRSIARVAKKLADRRVVVVASSDFTHYEPRQVAARQDQAAIDKILALDADGLKETVDRMGVTMCGVGPVAAALTAARSMGATTAEQVAYGTSGDATNDNDSVIGFAGIVIR